MKSGSEGAGIVIAPQGINIQPQGINIEPVVPPKDVATPVCAHADARTR